MSGTPPQTYCEPVVPSRPLPDDLYAAMLHEGLAPSLGDSEDGERLMMIENGSLEHGFLLGFAHAARACGEKRLSRCARQVWEDVKEYGAVGIHRQNLGDRG